MKRIRTGKASQMDGFLNFSSDEVGSKIVYQNDEIPKITTSSPMRISPPNRKKPLNLESNAGDMIRTALERALDWED